MPDPAPVSQRIVEKIASQEQKDPVTLDPPLQTVIDIDALDSLFSPTGPCTGVVSFDYDHYRVTVTDSGQVTVEEDSPEIAVTP